MMVEMQKINMETEGIQFKEISFESQGSHEKDDNFSFVDLFLMSEKEKADLMGKIAQTNGTVELWIHTHYPNSEIPQTKQQIEEFNSYLNQRTRFIEQGHKGNIPVIAFIESNPLVPGSEEVLKQYANYYRDFKKDVSKPSTFAYVRTFNDNSVPCVTRQRDYAVLSEDTRVDNWNEFGTLLSSLGAKNVILRGRNLAFENKPVERLDTAYTLYAQSHPELLDTEGRNILNVPSKCVGSAMVNLEVRGFKILNSQLTYPQSTRQQ